MPSPRITRELAQDTHDLVRKYGSIKAAAREVGIPRGTLHARYTAAMFVYNMPEVRSGVANVVVDKTPTGVILPTLLSSDAPVEALIEARKQAFIRARNAQASAKWMPFAITEAAPFAIVFVGDPHVDDEHCDWPTLERDLNIIEKSQGMYAVGLGDWTNNWTGKLARLYADQSTSKKEAWKLASWVLNRPIWLLLLRGNHDMWSGASDPLHWIASGQIVQDWEAQFTINCGDTSWRIHAAHDFPGSSLWNRLHAPLRKAKLTGFEADLYIAGHRHNWGIALEQDDQTGRYAWIARAKGYKAMDSHATRHGYGQQQDVGQSITAVFNPDNGRVRCFEDIEEAADYLRWMRR